MEEAPVTFQSPHPKYMVTAMHLLEPRVQQTWTRQKVFPVSLCLSTMKEFVIPCSPCLVSFLVL